MEQNIRDFRTSIKEYRRNNSNIEGAILDFDVALDKVREFLKDRLIQNLEDQEDEKEVKKDKEYLRKKEELYRSYITEIVFRENIQVRGYDGDKIYDFIDEMVDEIAGYSVLEDAFKDPEVSDIYVIDWQTIFVEKNGINQPYHKTFRSEKHLEEVIKRFIQEAGEKEINIGDNKIVHFELYGDRGCATSPAVTPQSYSLTMRKHLEDRIRLEDLINQKVMTQKIADLIGVLILGETNIIYAGKTGSGKTTTLRALLDHYVKRSNKRMLVCEDTQELFPEYKHSLQLVARNKEGDDSKNAITLLDIIYTALRLKPRYIAIGEVRGKEACGAGEAMETGHSTIFTMHGGTPWNIINRLVTKYMMAMPSLGIDVVERIIGAGVDYICIQDHIPNIGRRLTSITEVSYDFNTRRVNMKTICRYDFKTNQFIFENGISQEKADKMLRSGVPYDEITKWMNLGKDTLTETINQ